jgi:hypothetical protein
LGHGATAAHQPLELWILVRVQVPQLIKPVRMRGQLSKRQDFVPQHRTNLSFVFLFCAYMR